MSREGHPGGSGGQRPHPRGGRTGPQGSLPPFPSLCPTPDPQSRRGCTRGSHEG